MDHYEGPEYYDEQSLEECEFGMQTSALSGCDLVGVGFGCGFVAFGLVGHVVDRGALFYVVGGGELLV